MRAVYTFTTSPNAKAQALMASFHYAFYIAHKIDLKLMQPPRSDTVVILWGALGLDDANAYLEK